MHIYLGTWDVEINYREIHDKGNALEYKMQKKGRVNFVSDIRDAETSILLLIKYCQEVKCKLWINLSKQV